MQILSDMCFPDPYPMQGISLKGGSIFFIKSNFFSATGIFFHWFLLLKLWFFFITGTPKNFCIPRDDTYRYLFCPSGWALLSLGNFFVLQGSLSWLVAAGWSDKKIPKQNPTFGTEFCSWFMAFGEEFHGLGKMHQGKVIGWQIIHPWKTLHFAIIALWNTFH